MSAVISHQHAHQLDHYHLLYDTDSDKLAKFTELVNNDNGDKFAALDNPLGELHKLAGLHWMECL